MTGEKYAQLAEVIREAGMMVADAPGNLTHRSITPILVARLYTISENKFVGLLCESCGQLIYGKINNLVDKVHFFNVYA